MDSAPIQQSIQEKSGTISQFWITWLDRLVKTIRRNEMQSLPVYANNAAAVAGGLSVGSPYRTGADPDHVCVVH